MHGHFSCIKKSLILKESVLLFSNNIFITWKYFSVKRIWRFRNWSNAKKTNNYQRTAHRWGCWIFRSTAKQKRLIKTDFQLHLEIRGNENGVRSRKPSNSRLADEIRLQKLHHQCDSTSLTHSLRFAVFFMSCNLHTICIHHKINQ